MLKTISSLGEFSSKEYASSLIIVGGSFSFERLIVNFAKSKFWSVSVAEIITSNVATSVSSSIS